MSREAATAGLFGVAGFIGCLAMPYSTDSPIRALSAESVEAMRWSGTRADPGAQFLIVSGEEHWAKDGLAEWFPALAGRRSIATAQGYEWRGGDAFRAQSDAADELQGCLHSGLDCLNHWLREHDAPAGFLVVARSPYGGHGQSSSVLESELTGNDGWQLVFSNAAVAIFTKASG